MGTHPIFESDFDCLTATLQNGKGKGKEEGKGNLQCLLDVRAVANPGVQGSFRHDRRQPRRLHRQGRSPLHLRLARCYVLTSQADRFTKEELDSMMNAAPID